MPTIACQRLLNLLNFLFLFLLKTTSLERLMQNNEMDRVLFMLIQIPNCPENNIRKGQQQREGNLTKRKMLCGFEHHEQRTAAAFAN